MTFTIDAIVAVVVNIVFLIVWAVRLEAKLKGLEVDFVKCQANRDKCQIAEDIASAAVTKKLDTLLAQVARLEGLMNGKRG
jgi:hypothetical protein